MRKWPYLQEFKSQSHGNMSARHKRLGLLRSFIVNHNMNSLYIHSYLSQSRTWLHECPHFDEYPISIEDWAFALYCKCDPEKLDMEEFNGNSCFCSRCEQEIV